MNIVYIWIEQYKMIKNTELLINREYTVDFKYDKMNLSVKKNTESMDKLLFGENISITAVVGNNGVGKSTVLDFVREILFNTKNLKKYAKGFIIWENENKLFLYSLTNQEIKVTSNVSIEKELYLSDDFGLLYYSDALDLKDYNNMFDDGEDQGYVVSEEDAWDEYEEYIGMRIRNREWTQYNICTSYLVKKKNDSILNYFHEEIKKQLKLYKDIQNNVESVIPFPLPKKITFSIIELKTSIFRDVLDDSLSNYEYMGTGHHGENNTTSYTIGLLKKLEEIDRKKAYKIEQLAVEELIQWNIFLTYLYNQLSFRKEIREERDNYLDIDEELMEILGTDLPQNDEDFFKRLLNLFTKVDCDNWNEYKEFYNYIINFRNIKSENGCEISFTIPQDIFESLKQNIFELLDFSDERKTNDVISSIFAGDNSIQSFYMESLGWNGIRNIEDLLELFDRYSKLSYHVDFLQFRWGLSTGENNLFCLFARIFDVMSKNKCLKNVILFLDELDSSFHPKWQQRILKSLIDFLHKQFSDVSFQIVLTTHSPVLLSDIPKDNIVFMNIEDNKSKSEIKHEQTFAANIATLYYDSFFMEEGSIGEIAKSVIGRIIETINETKEGNIEDDDERIKKFANAFIEKTTNKKSKMNLEESKILISRIKRIIDNIGEDFWRYKITEQFDDLGLIKTDTNIQKLLTEIKKLENEHGKEAVKELLRIVEEDNNI